MPLDAAGAARKLKLGAAGSPVILGGEAADRAAFSAARGAPIPDRLGASHDWILLYVDSRAALEAAPSRRGRCARIAGDALDRLPEGLLEAPDGPHARRGLGHGSMTST